MILDKEQSKKFIKIKYKSTNGFVVKVGLLTITLSLSLFVSSCNFNTNIKGKEKYKQNIEISHPTEAIGILNTEVKPEPMSNYIDEEIIDEQPIINDPNLLINQESFVVNEKIKNDYNSNSIFVNHDTFTISDDTLNKINNLISSYPYECAFYVVTLDGSLSMGYNIDYSFPSASTVKGPYVLYCMKEIEKNNIDFNEEIVYEPRHYEVDTSIINDYKFYTTFTLDQVLYYTIHESDNVGYYMLQSKFPIEGYNKMLKELKCNNMILNNVNWGNVNAREMLTIWNEIYRYSRVSDIGQKYLDLLKNAKYNFIKEGIGEEYEVAHKSGFNYNAKHDVAIVYGDTPYLITIMTKNTGKTNYNNFIQNMSVYLNEAINEYNKYTSKQKVK